LGCPRLQCHAKFAVSPGDVRPYRWWLLQRSLAERCLGFMPEEQMIPLQNELDLTRTGRSDFSQFWKLYWDLQQYLCSKPKLLRVIALTKIRVWKWSTQENKKNYFCPDWVGYCLDILSLNWYPLRFLARPWLSLSQNGWKNRFWRLQFSIVANAKSRE